MILTEAVCYALEGALEKAIEQEQKSFEIYRLLSFPPNRLIPNGLQGCM